VNTALKAIGNTTKLEKILTVYLSNKIWKLWGAISIFLA